MKPKKFEYKSELFAPERGGVYVGFPFDGMKEFGTRGPVRVECWIDGYHKFCSLLPMGEGQHAIHVNAEIRKAIDRQEGDEVQVLVVENLRPRELIVPDDFQWFLDDDPDLNMKYNKLSFTVRSAMFNHINEAKRPETRANRLEMFLKRIKEEGFKR